MQEIRSQEDAEIRALMSADQLPAFKLPAFDAWIAKREAMVGSSRDPRALSR
jgi:hypothetical protein